MYVLIELKFFADKQHGFFPGLSTTTQLLECDFDRIEPPSSGKLIDVIYFDLNKAFDSVDRHCLISNLH